MAAEQEPMNHIWKSKISQYYQAYHPKKTQELKASGQWNTFLNQKSVIAADRLIDILFANDVISYEDAIDQVSQEVMPRDPARREVVPETYETINEHWY